MSSNTATEDGSTGERGLADRLDTLQQKRIVFVDWGKPNGRELYENFRREFSEEFGTETVSYYRKPSASSPIPEEMLAEILEEDPDGVILGIADCGSCNSSAPVDHITLENAGVPTVQIITEKFLDLNRTVTNGHGYEKLPLVTVPHPTRYLDADEVQSMSEDIMWSVYSLLTCEECMVDFEGG